MSSKIYIADLDFSNLHEPIVKNLTYTRLAGNDKIKSVCFKSLDDISDVDKDCIEYGHMRATMLSIFQDAEEIIVKGSKREEFLNRTLNRKVCVNTDDLGYPNFIRNYHQNYMYGIPDTVKNLKKWFEELMKDSPDAAEQAVFSYFTCGLDFMSKFELYFLPTTLIVYESTADAIRNNRMKLPPRTLNVLSIKNIINGI